MSDRLTNRPIFDTLVPAEKSAAEEVRKMSPVVKRILAITALVAFSAGYVTGKVRQPDPIRTRMAPINPVRQPKPPTRKMNHPDEQEIQQYLDNYMNGSHNLLYFPPEEEDEREKGDVEL